MNRANQPREFKIRGKWHRWQPAGKDGDTVGLTQKELDSTDFASVKKYFSVRSK